MSYRTVRQIRKLPLLFLFLTLLSILLSIPLSHSPASSTDSKEAIKWVDFDVPYTILSKTMKLDIESYQTEVHLDWIQLLAYLSSKYGGNYRNYKEKDLEQAVSYLKEGGTMEELAKDLKYYDYYREAYSAILSGFLGEHQVQVPATAGGVSWVTRYGMKVFSPIADGYWYQDYDDFGAGRSYGYDRLHFGHDLIVSTGTPVIAIESGIVEALGWNQYGGWRIGIRSYDQKRYYYYAHLRKDRPYAAGLAVGKAIKAGDVIGYSGRTGYSRKENVNNIDQPHLHVGMQLIFDEKEKDSPNQIWIDLYALTRLLSRNKSAVTRDDATKEYTRSYDFNEPNFYLEEEKKKSAPDGLELVTTVSIPQGSVPVPILMYHGLLKDPARQNEFYLSPATFEQDLAYLKAKGYQTVVMADLISYVDGQGTLPEKPVVLTMDDGFYNNYTYAYPLLKKYGMRAVISIVGTYTDSYTESRDSNPAYSYLTWDQIQELIQSGVFEPQNHSYRMHVINEIRKGASQREGESDEHYEAAMAGDAGLLQRKFQEMTGYQPSTFVFPFGIHSKGSTEILKRLGFRASLSCRKGINYITKDPDSLFLMKRILRPSFISSEGFFQSVQME